MKNERRFDKSFISWSSHKNQQRHLSEPLFCINPECNEDLQSPGVMMGQLEQLNPHEVFQSIECVGCGAQWADIYVLQKIEVSK